MPSTTKENKSSDTQASVVVLNRNAMRPVMFRIPGKTIRLGPGEKVDLPTLCESSRELGCLVRNGALKTWRISKEVSKSEMLESKVNKDMDEPKNDEVVEENVDEEVAGEDVKEETKEADERSKLDVKEESEDKGKSDKKVSRKKRPQKKSKD